MNKDSVVQEGHAELLASGRPASWGRGLYGYGQLAAYDDMKDGKPFGAGLGFMDSDCQAGYHNEWRRLEKLKESHSQAEKAETKDQPPNSRYMTVTYRITDEEEWRKTNPLQYRHNGLMAVTAGLGDVHAKLEEAEALLMRVDSEQAVIPTQLRRDIERFLSGENPNQ